MNPTAWIFVGVIGAASTYISLTTESDDLAIIAGLIGTLSWLLFAYSALNVTFYDGSGTERVARYPSMAAFGLAMAAPNVYVALTGPLELLQNRDQMRDEVTR